MEKGAEMITDVPKEYACRHTREQGNHYIKHVMAMTAEGLHRKSRIAAELAHRDIMIEAQHAVIEELRSCRAITDSLCTEGATLLDELREKINQLEAEIERMRPVVAVAISARDSGILLGAMMGVIRAYEKGEQCLKE